MHIFNFCEGLLNVTGLYKKCCTGRMLCFFFIFEVVVLVFMQVMYFQSSYCWDQTPLMYFWLMGQIMLFYIVVVVTICFFFRKFCSDPSVEEQYEEEEERADQEALLHDAPTKGY